MLANPEQFAAVRENRELLPSAIEEALRWDPPTMSIYRSPHVDIEVGGMLIPTGASVDIVIGSGNRDETAFPDPNRYDLHRQRTTKFMSFGHGAHVFIGQHLARLEITVAMNALLDRLPRLKLDSSVPSPKIVGLGKRSPRSIHVEFDAWAATLVASILCFA